MDCFSQLNGGFENWSTEYNYEKPDNWQTFNFLSVTFPPNPLSAFKGTGVDKHSGNYALKLKTIFVNNNPVPGTIADTIGRVFTGKITISPPSLHLGFPFVGRPEKLEFWCKYNPVGTDEAGAAVILQRWNGNGNDTIATGLTTITAIASYTLFQINLTYLSTALPDSAGIVFASSRRTEQARVGSALYIDDVLFTGWVGIDEPKLCSENIKIFPNPAKDNVNILAQMEEADNVQVADAAGKAVGIYKIQNYKVNLNTSAFSNGLYFYEIRDRKDRILNKGKFSVAK